MALCATKLAFFDDMWRLEGDATVLCHLLEEGGRHAIILDSTIFHPQGGGQPADIGRIAFPGEAGLSFVVEDVRSKDDGVVYHYGVFEDAQAGLDFRLEKGQKVHLHVDARRRNLNSRPFVEYKGSIPADQQLDKQKELEIEANALISTGGKVLAAVVPYEEASELCGGILPSYILKGTTPRIVRLGNNPGCPCGGTHVADIADIRSLKVTQIRVKKGYSKVFYTVGP